jgi:hypothetical protein
MPLLKSSKCDKKKQVDADEELDDPLFEMTLN